jgi:hypothetical protein
MAVTRTAARGAGGFKIPIRVDRVPSESDQLRDPQTVPIGDHDQGGVTMSVPAGVRGGLLQGLDFVGGQVLAAPHRLIRAPARREIPVLGQDTESDTRHAIFSESTRLNRVQIKTYPQRSSVNPLNVPDVYGQLGSISQAPSED